VKKIVAGVLLHGASKKAEKIGERCKKKNLLNIFTAL
jgi:hypothetical protein